MNHADIRCRPSRGDSVSDAAAAHARVTRSRLCRVGPLLDCPVPITASNVSRRTRPSETSMLRFIRARASKRTNHLVGADRHHRRHVPRRLRLPARLGARLRLQRAGERGDRHGRRRADLPHRVSERDRPSSARATSASTAPIRPTATSRCVEIQAWRSADHPAADGPQGQGAGAQGLRSRSGRHAPDHAAADGARQSPAFQTDGQFDPAKYQAALNDPNNEAGRRSRRCAPASSRCGSSRSGCSPRSSSPSPSCARRSATASRRSTLTMVHVPRRRRRPTSRLPTDADLDRVYQKLQEPLHAPRRARSSRLLVLPKKFGDEEVRMARELAQGLADRARRGEDFAHARARLLRGPGRRARAA